MFKIKTFIVSTTIMKESREKVCEKIDNIVNNWLLAISGAEIKNVSVSAINDTCSLVTVLYKE